MPVRPTRRAGSVPGPERLALIALAAWYLWVLTSPLWSGQSLSLLSPYLHAPLFVSLGYVAGKFLAPRWRRWRIPYVLVMLAIAALSVPFYANAQGAVGVQLVALAGLMVLGARPILDDDDRATPSTARFVVVIAVLVILASFLAERSDAAGILLVAVAVTAAWVVSRRRDVSRSVPITIGALGFGAAAAVVAFLGSRESWPEALNQSGSLSAARHTLWSDALRLWWQNPITGAGTDTFTESSDIASHNSHLETAHSSVLQVGSELGLVGLLLFVGLLGIGLMLATNRPGPAAIIGAAAWTALAIHSTIDHLYEFPPVTLAAGLVLGWANTRPPASLQAGPDPGESPW